MSSTPSQLTEEQVAHVAHLARLELTGDELSLYTSQMSAILSYVDQLSSVDTVNIEPVAQVTGLKNVMAEDIVATDPISRDAFLDGAPAAEAPYVKVKAVLE